MAEPTANYRSEFLKSPHHVAFGILTLGLGFASGAVLPLIAGATVYALGWVHLPDTGFFRRWVDKRHSAEQEAAALAQVNDFIKLDAIVTKVWRMYVVISRARAQTTPSLRPIRRAIRA
jgi:hypothetical protein